MAIPLCNRFYQALVPLLYRLISTEADHHLSAKHITTYPGPRGPNADGERERERERERESEGERERERVPF